MQTTKEKTTESIKGEIIKRTFAAKNFPKDSPIRKALNGDALTSEFMPSYKYIGKIIYSQTKTNFGYTDARTFKTKEKAEEFITSKLIN